MRIPSKPLHILQFKSVFLRINEEIESLSFFEMAISKTMKNK
jgi:hypothetical protein